MRYLLLITKDESKFNAMSESERAELVGRYMAWGKKVAASGKVRAGGILEHTDAATTVRVRDGKRLVTDGPFAETAEQVAGFVIIEADHLDEALELAAAHPDAMWASVEIRPLQPGSP